MFGYVIPNQAALNPEAQGRYRAAYCGLCRRIGALHGTRGRLTLSYDLTFLDLLLCSLYEGESACVTGCDHCPVHPIRKVEWRSSGPTDYCADLSVALHYYNAQDKWNDDHCWAWALKRCLLPPRSRPLPAGPASAAPSAPVWIGWPGTKLRAARIWMPFPAALGN